MTMNFNIDDVVVLNPDVYPKTLYYGQPMKIVNILSGVYECTDSTGDYWWFTDKDIKGYYANEDL